MKDRMRVREEWKEGESNKRRQVRHKFGWSKRGMGGRE